MSLRGRSLPPREVLVAIGCVIIGVLLVVTTFIVGVPTSDSKSSTSLPSAPGVAEGEVLPVGDGRFTDTGAAPGYLYTCPGFTAAMRRGTAAGGAQVRGPWFTPDGKGYRPDSKPHVRGEIKVPGTFEMQVQGDRRVIVTNGLPEQHPVGEFPVAPDDPVRAIDLNPNRITAAGRTYQFPAHPLLVPDPAVQCVGNQIGVMVRGAALLAPLDARGRDAVAWEVQDHCDGHPEPTGVYHYHGPSPCLPGTRNNEVIGYALDGFPIVGDAGEDGRRLTSADLDVCHGGQGRYRDPTTGIEVTGYRYAMTRDWPYTVACFRGSVLDPAARAVPPPPPGAEHPPR